MLDYINLNFFVIYLYVLCLLKRTEDQKLIYSGQLLHDSVTLKDILRRYEGQETHTVHLVCTPSRDSLQHANTVVTRVPSIMSEGGQISTSPAVGRCFFLLWYRCSDLHLLMFLAYTLFFHIRREHLILLHDGCNPRNDRPIKIVCKIV